MASYITAAIVALCASLAADVALAETVDVTQPDTAIETRAVSTKPLRRTTTERLSQRQHGQRFIEFRGEMMAYPGNTVIRHGFLGPDGEPEEYEALSFRPRHGFVGLFLGNIIPYPSKIGVYVWDDIAAVQTYRVNITKNQHERLVAYIEDTRRNGKPFYLYTDNCVRFARGAARAIGLKAPENTFIYPPIYVNMLRIANEGH